MAYDAAFFPADRGAFVRHWVAPRATRRGLALIEDGSLTGYGLVRRCRAGAKNGPLFADTDVGAELLFQGLAGDGGTVYLDTPEPNAAAVALASRHGLTPAFDTARMYRGAAPTLPLARTYGITTFELG